MKGLLLLLLYSFPLFCFSQSKITLEGKYIRKNIYVNNNRTADGKSFCTDSVRVNGKKISIVPSAAYCIPLDSIGFMEMDSIYIEIFHKNGCKPTVLQPELITPKSTFDLVSISVDKDAVLHWTTKNEISKLTYTIEQFRWNKWVKIGELVGNGGFDTYSYEFPLTMLHSGENKIRVKQVSAAGGPRTSKSVSYSSQKIIKPEIKALHFSPGGKLEFTQKTMYEIFDQQGNIMDKGFSDTVDCSKYRKGSYFVNFDNEMGEFVIY